jgi:hypothetical protein
MSTSDDVSAGLDGIRKGLEADGYGLEVVGAADVLAIRIVATEDACEDCLVSREVMARMMSGALGGRWAPEQIEIELPGAGR